MLAPELITELRTIAYCSAGKPDNRVAACSSLYKQGCDVDKVRATLYELATDIATPDKVKVRAIDLLDKIDMSQKPKDMTQAEAQAYEQSLLDEYVGNSNTNLRKI